MNQDSPGMFLPRPLVGLVAVFDVTVCFALEHPTVCAAVHENVAPHQRGVRHGRSLTNKVISDEGVIKMKKKKSRPQGKEDVVGS